MDTIAHTKPSDGWNHTFLCACETNLYIPNRKRKGEVFRCLRCGAKWERCGLSSLRRIDHQPAPEGKRMRTLLDREKTTPKETHLNVYVGGKVIGRLVGPGRDPRQLNREWTGYDAEGKVIGKHTGSQDAALRAMFKDKR